MLDHLRRHIAATLEGARSATLATSGPAGLLADVVPCVADDIQLYLLLPRTSDHLLNLEADSRVAVTTAEWQLRGRARVVSAIDRPGALALAEVPGARWSVLVEVTPERVDIARREGWGAAETIEVE
jgi:hypothetical protein